MCPFLSALNLEPIPKSTMNLDESTPGNNGAGQLNQGQIIGGFFSKRTSSLRKRLKKECVTSTTQRRAWKSGSRSNSFFSSPRDRDHYMRRIAPFPHLFSTARVACVQTQILWVVFLRFRTENHEYGPGSLPTA